MVKNTKRDVIIIISLLLISIIGYFIYINIINNKNVTKANVLYRGEVLVLVDFNKESVEIIKSQSNVDNYPIIDINNNTITLLGDYTIDGVRQEVVIKYNYSKRSMEIIKEESPNNICSNMGESTGMSLICAPNNITISFETGEDLDHEI